MGLAPVMVLRLFDLIRRVREEGYTILVVEQNVRQVLKLVDRAYLLRSGGSRWRAAPTSWPSRTSSERRTWACERSRSRVNNPLLLAEAAVNGLLLGGVLALLALGLNLIFGVLDIVWIAYVDLVMLCMYVVYFLVQVYGWPLWLGALAGVALGALLGRRRAPARSSRPSSSSPPVNQLLATGGLLFFIQSLATFLWTTDHRSVRLTLPTPRGRRHVRSPSPGCIAFVARGPGHDRPLPVPHPDLHRHRDPGRLAGPRRHGAHGRQPPAHLRGHLGGGRRAWPGVAAALLIIQYSVHPVLRRPAFGPITFMICVLGGLGNMVGAFIASFIMSEIISIGGVVWSTEMGYVIAFALFIVMMFVRPGGILAKRGMTACARPGRSAAPRARGLALAPFVADGRHARVRLHVLIQIFIWSFIGGAWSLMGRFGLSRSATARSWASAPTRRTLLWNFYGLTPWLGRVRGHGRCRRSWRWSSPIRARASRSSATTSGWSRSPWARSIRLLLIAERDWTGGSLGLTRQAGGRTTACWPCSSPTSGSSTTARSSLWLAGLWVWARLDRSMARSAMEAIGEDETAAASVGIHVTRFKLGITALSAVLTAVGGVAYAQYISYVNPDTLAGIGVSLRIVFAVVLGGMYSLLGPTVGTALTIALSEYLRVRVRGQAHRHGRDDLRAPARAVHHLPALRHLRQPAPAGAPRAGAAAAPAPAEEARRWRARTTYPARSRRGGPRAGRAGRARRRPRARRLPGARRRPLADLLPAAPDEGRGEPVPARPLADPRQAADGGGEEARPLRRSDRGASRPSPACTGRPTATTGAPCSTSSRRSTSRPSSWSSRRSAFQVLPLNTEKAHNLKEKSLEVIRMYRGLVEEQPTTTEEDWAFQFESAHFITLGLLYEQNKRFAGGAFAPILRRVDKFLKLPLRRGLEEREERAELVREADEALGRSWPRSRSAASTTPT